MGRRPGALAALADGSAAGLSAEDEALLEQFAQRYGQHIQAEEGTAYPSAQALLGEGDLRTMGWRWRAAAALRGANCY